MLVLNFMKYIWFVLSEVSSSLMGVESCVRSQWMIYLLDEAWMKHWDWFKHFSTLMNMEKCVQLGGSLASRQWVYQCNILMEKSVQLGGTWLADSEYINVIQGMFKKRLNFGDGAKIAIFSEIRLLQFFCSKFWQQTAVSRIPLHAVFIELQPQKWAGASHVWQIQLCNILRNNVCMWNSASNFGKRLWKHLNRWSKFTGWNAWVVCSAISGLDRKSVV